MILFICLKSCFAYVIIQCSLFFTFASHLKIEFLTRIYILGYNGIGNVYKQKQRLF